MCNLLSQVVQLAQLVHAYGLEHLEPGLDALRGRYPLDSQSAKSAGGGAARLNARQRRTLRRAFERAKAALDCSSTESIAEQSEAVMDQQRGSTDGEAKPGVSRCASRDPELHIADQQCSNASADTGTC